MSVLPRGVWALGVGAVLAASGCAMDGRVVDGQAALPPGENSAAFLDRLSSQTRVSENDAMRGMLMLLEGEDTAKTFDERVRKLTDQGVAGRLWRHEALRPVTRGKLAYMVYQSCGIPGGVILTLTGPSRRYCLRELHYRRMMTPGAEFAPVTGMEYVAVLSRADVCKRTGKIPDLVGETDAR